MSSEESRKKKRQRREFETEFHKMIDKNDSKKNVRWLAKQNAFQPSIPPNRFIQTISKRSN